MSGATSPLAHAISFLFVPALRPERVAKALSSGAGGVIVDLEDAVAPEHKAAARHAFPQALAAVPVAQRGRLLVRINPQATPWHEEDTQAAAAWVAEGVAGVVLPKAESAAEVQGVADALGARALLLPLIETGAGLDALDAIARGPQVLRVGFGHLDFQADLGMACGDDQSELGPVRLALVLASRRAGLPAPVDGVTPELHEPERLRADTDRSRRAGFGAKLCIHPSQLATVHAGLSPSAEELAWARKVLTTATARGATVFELDGRMVDAPVVRLARQCLAKTSAAPSTTQETS